MSKAQVLLEHYLKELRLPAMLRDYPVIAEDCARKKSDYREYLKLLCERELLEREERAAERRLKAAKFPVLKTLETFDFRQQPGINEPLLRELVKGEFVEKQENVILLGESGTGKTHLATSLGFAVCGQGKKVRFWSTGALVTTLLEARDQRTLQSMQQQLSNLDLLILDEMGYVPFTKAGAELLFEVISRCYERVSIIVTSNLPFAEWAQVFGNERMTGALLDRLTHHAHILEVNGESYRLKEAKRREARKRQSGRSVVKEES